MTLYLLLFGHSRSLRMESIWQATRNLGQSKFYRPGINSILPGYMACMGYNYWVIILVHCIVILRPLRALWGSSLIAFYSIQLAPITITVTGFSYRIETNVMWLTISINACLSWYMYNTPTFHSTKYPNNTLQMLQNHPLKDKCLRKICRPGVSLTVMYVYQILQTKWFLFVNLLSSKQLQHKSGFTKFSASLIFLVNY